MAGKITLKFNQLKLSIGGVSLLSLMIAMTPAAAKPSANQLVLAKQLGWIISDNPYNVCGGYYRELPIPYTPNPQAKSQSDNYNIISDQSEWALKGDMTFTGHVRVTQANREMKADSVHVVRNDKKRVISLDAAGHLRFIAPELLAIAKVGDFNLIKQVAKLKDVLYRAAPHAKRIRVVNPRTGKVEYRIYQLNAHGKAKEVDQVAPHIYTFSDASYTACPPTSNTWKVTAKKLKLDYTQGWGNAKSAWLYLKGVPVLYFPYYSFPITPQRKTGFLMPNFHHSSNSGYSIETPFYWNMAPNYDMLLTPQVMSKRGFMGSTLFRYLTGYSGGGIYAAVLPHDNEFAKFQQSARNNSDYNKPDVSDKFSDLENASTTRGAVAWNDTTHFTPQLYSTINFNYVTDDYYTDDLYNGYLGLTGYQLLQNASLNYANHYWSGQALVQRYQTLHPINRAAVSNQYQRLPELSFQIHPLTLWGGTEAKLHGDFTNFFIKSNPDSDTTPYYGQRNILVPALTLPIYRSYGFWNSELSLHSIYYETPNNPAVGTPQSTGAAIPIFDTHSKLIFVRPMRLFHDEMSQTFEPEIYYLYVPLIYQDKLPIYDTALRTFSYDEAFSNNRFSGDDRVGDANQVTLGATSRFINSETGEQRAQVGVAEIYYFRARHVDACYGDHCSKIDSDDKLHLSPIAGFVNYNLAGQWHLNAEMTWDRNKRQFDNQLSYLQYRRDNHHLINIGYNEVRDQAVLTENQVGTISDLKQAYISSFWQVSRKWSVLGNWTHNWATDFDQTINANRKSQYSTWTYGLQYDSCCWAFRVVGYRSFNGLDESYQATHNDGISFQFSLKGLGQISGSSATALINNNISGYQDDFGREKVL